MSRRTRPVERQEQINLESPSEALFNELHIQYPVCQEFVLNSEDDQICGCNKPFDAHSRQSNKQKREKSESEIWDRKTHVTLKRATNYRLNNDASCVRLDIETELNKVQRLLLEVWELPKPKLIMSIIGGANCFTLTDRLKSNFVNGIVNVATKSDIWMITSGYNNGLVQLVGQAIHKAKLRKPKQKLEQNPVAIAICKWGSVKNANKLVKSKKKSEQNLPNIADNEEETNIRKNDEHDLEMSHSHYLMLDDAKYRHLDTGDFRTRLCNQIAKPDHEDGFRIPTITIVVEGGHATIANIYYDLKSNIPVVIVDGSGRVADFFSRWLLYTKEFDHSTNKNEPIYGIDELNELKANNAITPVSNQNSSRISGKRTDVHIELQECNVDMNSKKLSSVFSKYKTQLEQDLKKLLYHNDSFNEMKHSHSNTGKNDSTDKITVAVDQVMYCLQGAVRSNITVFHLNSENNLSDSIFGSICKSYERLSERRKEEKKTTSDTGQLDSNEKDQNIEQTPLLELAMDWDCIDVAKEFVLKNSLYNIANKKVAFKDALTRDLYTFAYEFIKLGINPAKIYFPENTFIEGPSRYEQFIKDLYTDKIIKHPSTHLKSFIEDDSAFIEKEIDTVDKLNVTFRTLIGDYMHKLYFDTSREEAVDRLKSGLTTRLTGTGSANYREVENISSLKPAERKVMAQDYIMRDLFLWSILMNHINMAIVLLSHMKYRICPALIATKILKQYYQKATYGELKDSYLESANYFEQYAITCLEKCDDNNADQACEIILQRNELYGYVTCLQVAADAQDELFIATPCCVQAMNNIWYDKLYPEQKRKRDIASLIVGMISLGLAAPILVTYRECEEEEQGNILEPTLRSCGINYCDPYRLEYPRYLESNLEMNRYIHRIKNFHQSLSMKYFYHFITYCFFLLLFSYVLLFNFEPPTNQTPSIHWTEILTILLVSSMLIEEIHYFLTQDSLTFFGKSRNYFRDIFKPMTLLAIVLFYIGLILRFTYADSEEEFSVARIVMAFDIELWWLRFLSFVIVIPFLGPHLVAIWKMIKDLLFFICIIIIVMAGYGVASRSMVYYPTVNNFTTETGGFIDTSFNGRSIFRQIAYPVYYLMYGEFDTELANLDTNPNAGWSIATQVLLAMHMLFVNILLTNLLIAMFSKRFDQVYDDTKNIWYSQQYLYTREYYTRSPFIPPISLIYDIYYLSRMFFFFIQRKVLHKSKDRKVKVFKMIPKNKSLRKKWYEFESASTYAYAHFAVKALKDALTNSSSSQDSHGTEKKEDMTENENEASNIRDNLKQVQNTMTKLNSTVEGMKGDFKNYFK